VLDLLAVMNGDGGHYLDGFGLEAACKRAEERFYVGVAAQEAHPAPCKGGLCDMLSQGEPACEPGECWAKEWRGRSSEKHIQTSDTWEAGEAQPAPLTDAQAVACRAILKDFAAGGSTTLDAVHAILRIAAQPPAPEPLRETLAGVLKACFFKLTHDGAMAGQRVDDFWQQMADAARAAQEAHPAPSDDESEDEDRLRARLSDLLTRTANALRGEPPPLTVWSWHDLPERAAAAMAAIDLMQTESGSTFPDAVDGDRT